jgi:hypothetical protein
VQDREGLAATPTIEVTVTRTIVVSGKWIFHETVPAKVKQTNSAEAQSPASGCGLFFSNGLSERRDVGPTLYLCKAVPHSAGSFGHQNCKGLSSFSRSGFGGLKRLLCGQIPGAVVLGGWELVCDSVI